MMTKSDPRNDTNDTHEEVGHNKHNYGSTLPYIVDFVETVFTTPFFPNEARFVSQP